MLQERHLQMQRLGGAQNLKFLNKTGYGSSHFGSSFGSSVSTCRTTSVPLPQPAPWSSFSLPFALLACFLVRLSLPCTVSLLIPALGVLHCLALFYFFFLPRTVCHPSAMAERGRTRERTPKPSKPSKNTIEPTTTTAVPTQLPPVGSHHQVLEQPVGIAGPLNNSTITTANRPDSSDTEKKPPEPKKMKLEKTEPETQPDTPMEPAPPILDHSQVFGPREVFDLTTGDETEDGDELKQCGEPVLVPRRLPEPGPFPNLPRQASGSGNPETMPEWLRTLTDSIQGLHVKSDRAHEYCVQLGSSIAQHDTRLSHLEAVAKEHTESHENNTDRITALEQAVTELDRKLRSCTPPRSAPGTPRT